ncbi:MAG: sporulation transcriptional regulator SpoIIID [Clostridia bacterium]|nr:sporulation transcriptional regulator SpoIIID [Clostridia bacterium]
MRGSIRERVRETANYIIEHRATVRAAAKVMGVSKSTVHTDMTVRLARLDASSYKAVKAILDVNREERHIRGGESTRKKYKNMR